MITDQRIVVTLAVYIFIGLFVIPLVIKFGRRVVAWLLMKLCENFIQKGQSLQV